MASSATCAAAPGSMEKSNKSSLWNHALDPVSNRDHEPFWPWELSESDKAQNHLPIQSARASASVEANSNGRLPAELDSTELDPIAALLGPEAEIPIQGISSVEPPGELPYQGEVSNSESRPLGGANSWFAPPHADLAEGGAGQTNSHDWRANLYVVLAALTIVAALSIEGYRTNLIPVAGNPPAAGNSAASKPAKPNADNGNPQANVWVDTKHAQYYCSDSRRYGNTKHGEFMKQGQAQVNHYQPAEDKACE